jgi:hypothetical protein
MSRGNITYHNSKLHHVMKFKPSLSSFSSHKHPLNLPLSKKHRLASPLSLKHLFVNCASMHLKRHPLLMDLKG